MPVKDTSTEELIRSTAKRIFFTEGRLHATTQDIADAAGVNRTALHYYFRTRDQLINDIFQSAMQSLSLRLGKAMDTQKPFRQKTEDLIDIFLADMLAFPYMETFMVTEINHSGQELIQLIDLSPTSRYLAEIEKEMEKGTIEKMNPIHFLINLFSLLSYPLIMAPLYKSLFGLSQTAFETLIQERKQIITGMLFKKPG